MEKAVIVIWPYSQNLMEAKGFYENALLINTEKGLDEFGSSAYLVDEDWYDAYKNGTLDEDYADDGFPEVAEVDDDVDLSKFSLAFPQPYTRQK